MTDKDRDLEQAWHAASHEQPPKALDDRILAAAHRAAASGPRKLAPEATRPPRWWMPLAAAAVIGVVAIGVVQLVPNETVYDAPPPHAPASDTAMLNKVQKETEQPPAAPPAAAPAPAPVARADKAAEANVAAAKQRAASPPPPPAPAQSTVREQKLAASAPEPFPQKTEQPRDALADKDARSNERQEAMPARPAAPAPAATAPMAAPGRAMMRAQSDYASAAGAIAQNAPPAEEARRKARDPDAWIAEIRKLKDAGQLEDALRELKAFREAVPEAEKKLPADLRDLK